MKNTTYLFAGLIVLILIIAGGLYAYTNIEGMKQANTATTTAMTAGTVAQYSCAQGAITATFSDSGVMLMLPDGTTLTLANAISGSGFRYESGTNVFAGKGSDATLTQNGLVTYGNCLAGTNTSTGMSGDTNAGMKSFTDSAKTFSFMYPSMFTVTGSDAGYTTDWSSGSSQTGLVLAQVSIPQSFEPKTNFGDAKFTIGTSPDPIAVKNCLVAQSGGPLKSEKVTINGTAYTKLTYSDAGAGNRYDTVSYRTVRNSQCYAIEYTIHSSQFANYPAGSITEFDQTKIQTILESVAHSFRFL